jgi:hypothetical protein
MLASRSLRCRIGARWSPYGSSGDGPAITAKDATLAALTVRAERAEAEADRLIAAVQLERARAESAETATATERAAREKAEAALATAEAEVTMLRQAEKDRRALGLVARLRAA